MNDKSSVKSVWVKRFAWIAVVAGVAAGGAWYVLKKNPESAEKAAEVASVPIEKSAQPVRITHALQQPIQAWVFSEGTARSVKREYLTFDRAGRVTFVKRSHDGGDLRAGEAVRAGEVLARIDPRQYESEIDTAQASVAEAKAQLDAGRSDIKQAETQYELSVAKFRRTELLLKERATSKAEYEEVEANLKNAAAAKTAATVKLKALAASVTSAEAQVRQAQLSLEETEIISPIDGIVAYLNIEEGYYFTQTNIKTTSESDALQTIPIVVIDPSLYEVTVDVPAYQADSLQVGQEVLLVPGGMSATTAFESHEAEKSNVSESSTAPMDTLETHAQTGAKGAVFSINPAVNPGGRSVQLKIRTTQGSERLKDGMFIACWIEVQNKPDAIVASFDAFLFEENRPYVFVVDPDGDSSSGKGIARRVDVSLGIESLTTREILNGVRAGEILVSEGRYRLVDKAPVRMVNKEAIPPTEPEPATKLGADLQPSQTQKW